MQPGGRTGKHLEMVAVMAGNYTQVVVVVVVVDDIDSRHQQNVF